MTTHVFQKRCKACKEVYFTNVISQAAYENVIDNTHITVEVKGDLKTATIDSVCDLHVDSYQEEPVDG